MSGRRRRIIGIVAVSLATWAAIEYRHELLEKRVVVVEDGKLVRGAWQRPIPLRRMIDREGIRSIVTLTAINTHDPKYEDQDRVVEATGVDWTIVPMRGSTATLPQLAEAADLLADPDRQPVFFHCVAGHHRTNLVLAAYRIRHEGWTADEAWDELVSFPWTRPEADADDRLLIQAFAALHRRGRAEEPPDVTEAKDRPTDHPARVGHVPGDHPDPRLAMDDGERRHR